MIYMLWNWGAFTHFDAKFVLLLTLLRFVLFDKDAVTSQFMAPTDTTRCKYNMKQSFKPSGPPLKTEIFTQVRVTQGHREASTTGQDTEMIPIGSQHATDNIICQQDWHQGKIAVMSQLPLKEKKKDQSTAPPLEPRICSQHNNAGAQSLSVMHRDRKHLQNKNSRPHQSSLQTS